MSNLKKINNKIFSIKDLKTKLSIWRENGEKIIFTNGCFDIIHKGHIQVLANTADLGDRLIIGPFTPQPTKEAVVNIQTRIRTIFIVHIMGNNAHKCTVLD